MNVVLDIMMEKTFYRCVNCNSSHVLEEDESVLKNELNTINISKTAESKSKVVQTPPSSLGKQLADILIITNRCIRKLDFYFLFI